VKEWIPSRGGVLRSIQVARFAPYSHWLVVVLLFPLVQAVGAPPSEALLPDSTKGFIAIPNVEELREKFNQTQFGLMVHDPAMKPFMEDLQQQIKEKLLKAGVKLAITMDDLRDVASGEITVAAIQPTAGDKNSHAEALIVDITGHEAKAKLLMEKIGKSQTARGAAKTTRQYSGVDMVLYALPLRPGQTAGDYGVYFIRDNHLVVTDHIAVAVDIASRFGKTTQPSLQDQPAFKFIMERQRQEAGELNPQVRWFVEPIGYAEVTRALAEGPKKRGTDMIKILAQQGFNAVKGLGGHVYFATGKEELLHKTFIYAPAVPKVAGMAPTDKYNLAARMLDFPNSENLQPQAFVPNGVASYLTFNWKMKNAFNYVGTLVDAIAGEKGVFDEVLLSLKNDPNGPKVDIRAGLVAHLKERATMMTDYRLPITTKSERWLVAVEIGDAKPVAETVRKAFANDPTAKKRIFGGVEIWEIIQDQNTEEVPMLNVEGGFTATENENPVQAEDGPKPMLPNSAIAVVKGHLVVASHVDFLVEMIKRNDAEPSLYQLAEYQRVDSALARLGAGKDAFRFFARTDESYRPTYELLQQGKMPEAETLLAKGLNALMTPKEEGVLRKQQIDGSKLPPCEEVRKYFGPTGLYVQTEDNGWRVVGCLLKKAE
jgi:hypothetical protein